MGEMERKFVSTYVKFVSSDSASFEEYLKNRREDPSTLHLDLRFGGYPLFYPSDPAITDLLGELEKTILFLKDSLDGLPAIARKEFLRACLVEEIIQTNEIEGVFSTRQDVYRLLDDVRVLKKSKIRSIVNKYGLLLSHEPEEVSTLQDIRSQYDQLMEGALDKKDRPDGKLFRKGPVSVTDGVRVLHNGLFPEERIAAALQVFLSLGERKEISLMERLFIGHYIFEYAHPFYDGNGRCGRYLMALFALEGLPQIVAFRLSTAIGKRKQRYYAAFSKMDDVRNRSDISTFVYPNLEILLEECQFLQEDIIEKKERAKAIRESILNAGESLEDNAVLKYLAEATAFTSFGLRIEDLVSLTSTSVATVNRSIKDLSEKGWLIKEKNGYQSYYRLNIDAIG